MQAIHAENVTWKAQARGVREASIYNASHGSEETRIDMIEVPPGSYIPAHRHASRTEFITILSSAGAQLQIGERIFRPLAGQVFHREPGDVLALTNDSQHPFCFSVVRFGYEASDIEVLSEVDDDERFPFSAATTEKPVINEKVEETAPPVEEKAEVADGDTATEAPETEAEAEESETSEDTPDDDSEPEDDAKAEAPKPAKKSNPKKSKNKKKSSKDKKSKK